MSEELIKNLEEQLKEEKWTRETIGSYTENKLNELAVTVEKAKQENCIEEIKAICDEHLAHTKDSIIALYISGMLGLKKGALDNSALVTLVDIFKEYRKDQIVINLCYAITDVDPNNKFALRTLAECYREANDEKVWEIYEKIVKLDFEEADIAKILAEHYENAGDMETAISYYKKAILRYIGLSNVNSIKEIWTKLISVMPDEIEFFRTVQKRVEKSINPVKSALLMQELYPHYKDTKQWDIAISILKDNLRIDPKDNWARREITDCFREKHAGHSRVEDYIRSSNLGSSYRNVFEAISDFEKHIAFDVNNFVYHKTWHVGVIQKVENDNLVINFGAGKVQEMSLKMAVTALQPLAKNHIWVLKATKKKEVLAKKIKEDKAWALKIIIKSFDNCCDFKRIKAELVPSLLSVSEWTSWNSSAKKVLENDSTFGVNPNNINEYTVRTKAITQEEKLNNEFKAQKLFFPRVDILMKYVNDEVADIESDLFEDMLSYFKGFLKAINNVTEYVVASYLVVKKVGLMHPSHAYNPTFTFAQLYSEIENPREMYTLLKDTKNTSLRSDFLDEIRGCLVDWADQYVNLFPTVLSDRILSTLISEGKLEEVKKLIVNTFEDYRSNREAVLYFFEKCQNAEWFKNAGVTLEEQFIAILNIISQCYREIDNHVNSTDNKKIIKNACKLLFEGENVYGNYMMSLSKEDMGHIYQLVDDISALEPSIKTQLRNKILEKYPDYKFHKKEETSVQPKGMWVTKAMLDAKKAEEEKLSAEVPKIAQEVAEARDKGDLKENAEYHAAKDAQHKLNLDLKRLKEELARAIIFDPTTATSSFISFGTVVTLANTIKGIDEEYTILGPWESNPEAGIISYMSPLGNALLDAKVGDDLSFKINGNDYKYTVKAIKVAKF